MKSPREILLKQHRSATPKLDALRREVLGTELKLGEAASIGWFVSAWRELVLPCRRVWTGLAMVWAVVVVINISQREHSTPLAKNVSNEMAVAFQQQQKLLAELVGPVEKHDAEPPKKITPRPSSERQVECLKA